MEEVSSVFHHDTSESKRKKLNKPPITMTQGRKSKRIIFLSTAKYYSVSDHGYSEEKGSISGRCGTCLYTSFQPSVFAGLSSVGGDEQLSLNVMLSWSLQGAVGRI